MRIAILGTRGIPARYGGFETFAEQLSLRLARDGHEVIVYCRRAFTQPDDVLPPGVRRVILPGLPSKHFDTLWHTLLATLHVVGRNVDVVLICNVANSIYAWIPRLFGKPTILNVDGLDRKRKKWNVLGRAFLHICEILSAVTPSRVVTDSLAIQSYYRRRYRRSSRMIAYGAEAPKDVPGPEQFHLTPGKFILYVTRLEPENNVELLIRAYAEIETDWPLVIVGGNPYRPEYVQFLKQIADPRVIFTGPVYGEGYWILQKGAGMYVSACEIGGTHPTLVEAMAAGNPLVYLDTPENRETVADCGIRFSPEKGELAQAMRSLLGDADLRDKLSRRALRRAEQVYSWDAITAQYEALFSEATGSKLARPARESV
jgi:glycosyltransferase involved in cell wall biosynthesis